VGFLNALCQKHTLAYYFAFSFFGVMNVFLGFFPRFFFPTYLFGIYFLEVVLFLVYVVHEINVVGVCSMNVVDRK
jgi:hypothetical protein